MNLGRVDPGIRDRRPRVGGGSTRARADGPRGARPGRRRVDLERERVRQRHGRLRDEIEAGLQLLRGP